MNLAIEYLMRTRLSQQMLKTPCSLFLNNVFDRTPLVVTIQNCYGKPQEVVVKHWRLDRITGDRVLPPVEEFVVNRDDIFASPFVVLDDYNIVDYTANPYPIHHKQSADEPYATQQEKQYQECLDRFFNSSPNENKRRNWLWKIFISSFFPESLKSEFGSLQPEHQREAIQNLCPVPWKGWCMWKTHLMCDTQSPVATELAFSDAFSERLKANEKYQEMIKPKPKSKTPQSRKELLENAATFITMLTNATGGNVTAGSWTLSSYTDS